MGATLEAVKNPFTEWVERYRNNPPRFVYEVLGVMPDKWQIQCLRAYGRGERKMSIRSSHGPGKTAVAAWMALHQLLFRFPQKTVVTAPSAPQLFDAFYVELKHWITKLPPDVQTLLEIKSDRIELKHATESSFLSCRTSRSDTPEALAGVHSKHVLLICDEASGIPEAIFEAAAGSMSGGAPGTGENATTLLIGNPVRTSGLFFDSHTRLKSTWWTMHVSAFDSPRVSDEYVQEMAEKYGEESNVYRVRVLGEFPLVDDDCVIPFTLVEAAQNRDVQANPDASIVWGLDVARFGSDKSALCKRKRNVVLEPVKVWSQLDLMELTGRIKHEWDDTQLSDRPTEILVDSIGMGAGVEDRLKELGLPARGINVSESPALGDTYRNLRTELWFAAKDWLSKLDCKLPKDDDKLAQELVIPKYGFTSNGKMYVESKDDMRKRGFASPDIADAFVLTFGGGAATSGWGPQPSWNKPMKREIRGIV